MSKRNVDRIIERLLSDEELRIRFALDRFDAIADLHERGLPLSAREIDLFVLSDVQTWFEESPSDRTHMH
jgi:hypothetical protein